MQMPYLISDITEYGKLARTSLQFPNYSEDCPLCHGKDCAVQMGFYYRKCVIFLSQTYSDIPIHRYLCRKKGQVKHSHSTFSLLPCPLIPYRQCALEVVIEALRLFYHQNLSYSKIKDSIANMSLTTFIDFEDYQIRDFLRILKQSFFKLTTNPQLKSIFFPQKISPSICTWTSAFDFIFTYQSPFSSTTLSPLSPPQQCALDFFFSYQEGDCFNRHFLFGTPSQKRLFCPDD